MRISSTHNSVVQYVRSLEKAAVRRAEGVFLAEGIRLLSEAVASGQPARVALYAPDVLTQTERGAALAARLDSWATETYEVSERVLNSISQTTSSAGVVAVLPEMDWPRAALDNATFGLVLDRLSDPGNVGTILRSSAAFGAGYVATLPGTVDVYSPKVVRSAMGAHFRVPLFQGIEWVQVAGAHNVQIVAATSSCGQPLGDFDWPERTVLVIGNEAHGLSADVANAVQHRVHIPMQPGVESLNASVAASLLLYTAIGNRPDRT